MTVSSPSCWRWGRFSSAIFERDRHPGAERDRDRHADPHRPQRVPSALLGQERRDDADDERRFEALAQADDECGEHETQTLIV